MSAPTTRVVNLRREPYDIYIGRAGRGQDGYFGNPYRVKRGKKGGLEAGSVLEMYRLYFHRRLKDDPAFRERVSALKGKTLGCFCKPGPCHGDVIAAWLEREG